MGHALAATGRSFSAVVLAGCLLFGLAAGAGFASPGELGLDAAMFGDGTSAAGARGSEPAVTARSADEVSSLLVADFSATPTCAAIPFDTQFTDLSAGNPTYSRWEVRNVGSGVGLIHEGPSPWGQDPWGCGISEPGHYDVILTIEATTSSSVTKPWYLLGLFPDVLLDHWAWREVIACVDAGIVQGYSIDYREVYQPTNPVTRDQMAVYISRALAGGDVAVPPGPAEASFSDVSVDYWAYKHVEYCFAHGVVQGYDSTHYRPDVVVSRDQMAVFVARAVTGGEAGVPNPYTCSQTLTQFTDMTSGFWACRYVKCCRDHNIVQGYSDGTYQPGVTVTRDQMAVYMQRAFKLPM